MVAGAEGGRGERRSRRHRDRRRRRPRLAFSERAPRAHRGSRRRAGTGRRVRMPSSCERWWETMVGQAGLPVEGSRGRRREDVVETRREARLGTTTHLYALSCIPCARPRLHGAVRAAPRQDHLVEEVRHGRHRVRRVVERPRERSVLRRERRLQVKRVAVAGGAATPVSQSRASMRCSSNGPAVEQIC